MENQPTAAAAEPSPAQEIAGLPWDDDLPVALGDESEQRAENETENETGEVFELEEVFDYGDEDDDTGRRSAASAQRRESWRTRSATGAIATALAMGLQQVFEPEKRRPAIVAEAPSDPYTEDDPITVDYAPDDAEGTRVHVKPWLLQKEDPT